MGLDIRYYERVRREADLDAIDYDEADRRGLERLANDGDPDRWDSRLYDLTPGWHRVAGSAQGRFRAGSYSTYNAWREILCRLAFGVEPHTVWENPDDFTGRPFYEVIDFTDCDGCIGPGVSSKLAEDFRKHREKFGVDAEPWELEVYDDFANAFNVARRGGVVMFR